MGESERIFKLEYEGDTIGITEHSIGGNPIYRVTFGNWKKPLVITQAVDAKSNSFWTSLPQGRQKEAEEIALLIKDYFKER